MLAQNLCFAVAHIGTGVYIHSKLQNKNIPPVKCFLYSSTGSVLFNYGSLVILANLKHYLPAAKPVRVIIGVSVLGYLFWIGRDYLISNETCEQS